MFSSIIESIKKAVLGKYLASFIRSIWLTISGLLTGLGLAGEVVTQFADSGEQVTLGLVMYAIGQFASWYNAKKNSK